MGKEHNWGGVGTQWHTMVHNGTQWHTMAPNGAMAHNGSMAPNGAMAHNGTTMATTRTPPNTTPTSILRDAILEAKKADAEAKSTGGGKKKKK